MSARKLLVVALLSQAFWFGCGSGAGSSGGSGSNGNASSPYKIGGSVTGLIGSVTLNNNADILTVNGGGNFVFDNALTTGTIYDVTVGVQPSNPPQYCRVSNGAGTVQGTVTNVVVTCKSVNKQVLFNFGPNESPTSGLIFDASGNLYGTSSTGVYKLSPAGAQWTETVLYAFCQLSACADGSGPNSGVIWDAAGNLYGTTSGGGAYGQGTVFELTPSGNGTWTETVLHSFGNGVDGSGFISGLAFDKSGNLYGTTWAGGNVTDCLAGCGTVFQLSPDSNGGWSEMVIYAFCPTSGSKCPDGSNPSGGVVIDQAGNLYGTTTFGGSDENGTVFQLSSGTGGQWTERVLHVFQSGPSDGATPHSGLILDAAGNLYGTTEAGYCGPGFCNNGTVFEVTRGTGDQWQEALLYGFYELIDGSLPAGPLLFDKAGNLYGTTVDGGVIDSNTDNYGVVFALTKGSANSMWPEVPIYTFAGALDGYGPGFNLVMDSENNLYGVALGGANATGLVFRMTP